jgi:hypothetical protein
MVSSRERQRVQVDIAATQHQSDVLAGETFALRKQCPEHDR